MHVLAIDTSTMLTSVAVVAGTGRDTRVLAQGESSVETHSGALLQLIDQALQTAALSLAELDGLAIGAGPGSFTGLRIGMATAKGLAFAAKKPLWAVSSLAALALDVERAAHADARTLIVPLLDARRQEIFAGFYRVQDGMAESLADERVMAPGELAAAIAEMTARTGCERSLVLGEGLRAYAHVLDPALHGVAERIADAADTPQAVAVARLAMNGHPPDISVTGAPVYIRPSEAEIKFPEGNAGGTFSSRS